MGLLSFLGNVARKLTGADSAERQSKATTRANLDMFEASELNTSLRQRAANKFAAQQSKLAHQRNTQAAKAAFNRDLVASNQMFKKNAAAESRINKRERQESLADYQRQMRDQMRIDSTKIQRLARDAGKAGIHPLAALGVSSTFQAPTIPTFSGGVSGTAPQSSFAPASPAQGSFAPSGTPPYAAPPAGGSSLGDMILDGVNAYQAYRTAGENSVLSAKQLEVMESEIQRNKAMGAAALVDARSRTVASAARASMLGATTGIQNLEAAALGGTNPPGRGLNPPAPQVSDGFGGLTFPGHETERQKFEVHPGAVGVTLPGDLGVVYVPNEDALGDGFIGPTIAGTVGAKRQVFKNVKQARENPGLNYPGSIGGWSKIWELSKWIGNL